jgi:DNA-binding IscR family transcriptional regulator
MFSTTCEYALRALVQLARMPEGTAVLGRDLARNADIPANYLSKIQFNPET